MPDSWGSPTSTVIGWGKWLWLVCGGQWHWSDNVAAPEGLEFYSHDLTLYCLVTQHDQMCLHGLYGVSVTTCRHCVGVAMQGPLSRGRGYLLPQGFLGTPHHPGKRFEGLCNHHHVFAENNPPLATVIDADNTTTDLLLRRLFTITAVVYITRIQKSGSLLQKRCFYYQNRVHCIIPTF